MKIGQYKCSIPDGVLAGLGVAVEPVPVLPGGQPYDYDVLVWNNCERFGRQELNCFPQLKTIINWGTDDDNLDEELLHSKGIVIKKIDYYATETLAEYILSIMLLFERQHIRLLDGEKLEGGELYRKRVGIIGLGKIGYRTATMLQGTFGCQIYYYSKVDKHLPDCTFVPLAQLFAECDYIIITAKSATLTIDIGSLPAINPQLVIVNISRDSILPLTGLLPLLETGALRGFIGDLDLPEMGALPDNVMLLPHRGYLTKSSKEIKSNILAFYLRQLAGVLAPAFLYFYYGADLADTKVGSANSPLSLSEEHIRYVYASPQAQKTAKSVADKLGAELQVIPELGDMDLGVFAGKPRDELERLFGEFFAARKANGYFKLDIPYPSGESYYDVYLRVLRPLMRILASGQPSLIITDQRVAKVLEGIASGKPLENMVYTELPQDGLMRLGA